MSRLAGYYGRPRIPRTIRFVLGDKAVLARQFREWSEMAGLEHILVSHGEPIVDDPAGTLRRLANELD